MFDFMAQHSDVISVIVNIILTIVWIVYLNLFFISHRRQKSPMILIRRGAGTGPEARLFISNMGAEPIYVSALIADCYSGDKVTTAYITQNDHISAEELSTPDAATNEGPLGSGDYLDAGSFDSLMKRIERHSDQPLKADEVERVTITVVASTGYSALISAASSTYTILQCGQTRIFHPEHVSTIQHTGRRARRRIRRRLEQQIESELEMATPVNGQSKSEAA
ncbi:hypothetical protein SAMN04488020_105236 [Palleronia marisminoris]|uniref:Uncharacterized protein n=1 Tax=Palleronia marisminoris TaxID=315423 RepID=A0A1Y5SW22_9RHOB|nr:hypothetical protein [Palleronia marisminoris]SFG98950.1 hypothetical protein SAMN04488020_105236 [Palleronia marisminoris]SLN48277.1 hypothetical protein PAM7066_02180 [Palleronia marisminoris]